MSRVTNPWLALQVFLVSVCYSATLIAQLSTEGSQAWRTLDTEVFGARLGSALTVGDFNADGYQDLAMSAPGWGGHGGAVQLLFGADSGFLALNGWFEYRNNTGLPDEDKGHQDDFGRALAMGDFNGDGRSDLAIGAPGMVGFNGAPGAGRVYVIYARPNPIDRSSHIVLAQGHGGMPGVQEKHDQFGRALATGDFNCDGFDDLAIGAPQEDIGEDINTGAVIVSYGTPTGLGVWNSELWHQDSEGMNAALGETNDEFGHALATGDFDGNGCADLAVGVPGEDVVFEDAGEIKIPLSAGQVQVLYGESTGLGIHMNAYDQSSPGVPGKPELFDWLGFSLATGDFNGDGFDDLVSGVAAESIGDVLDAGAVMVFYGSNSAILGFQRAELWDQGSPEVFGVPEEADQFGHAVAAGDFTGDGADDLVIGSPREDIRSNDLVDGGLVQVFQGIKTQGITTSGNVMFSQDTENLVGIANQYNHFGWSLASGDFDGNGRDDLAIGAPGVSGGNDFGEVSVLYSKEPFTPQKPSVSLSVDRNFVLHGESVELTWNSSRAKSCNSSWSNDPVPISGSAILNVSEDVLLWVSCINAVGSATDSIKVILKQNQIFQSSFES